MLQMNDLKVGKIVTIDKEPYTVLYTQHVQMGRGGPVLRTKLKNLLSEKVLEKTYKPGDQIEEADLTYKKAQFLYKEGSDYFFMDNESYEQFSFVEENMSIAKNFIKDGDDVDVMHYEGKPVSLKLPAKATLKVTSAAPGVKGDTAQGSVTKPCEVETGYTVNTPLFIKEGDMIRINTETGEYVERIKE